MPLLRPQSLPTIAQNHTTADTLNNTNHLQSQHQYTFRIICRSTQQFYFFLKLSYHQKPKFKYSLHLSLLITVTIKFGKHINYSKHCYIFKKSLFSSLSWQFFIKTYSKMLRSTMSIQQPAFQLFLFQKLFFTLLVKEHYPAISFFSDTKLYCAFSLLELHYFFHVPGMKFVEIMLKTIN